MRVDLALLQSEDLNSPAAGLLQRAADVLAFVARKGQPGVRAPCTAQNNNPAVSDWCPPDRVRNEDTIEGELRTTHFSD